MRNLKNSLFVAVIIFFNFLTFAEAAEIKLNGVYLPQSQPVSTFHLTDNNGKPFSQENLKGQWTMLFFGFTNCSYVCPTTLSALNRMYHILEKDLPANQLPNVVMVSVDPARDSVQRMNSYVHSFNTHFKGVRSDEIATQKLEKQFHIAAVKMEADNGKADQYTINHTADIILVNPQGKIQAYLSFPHKPEQMVKDYKSILTAGVN